MKKETKKFIHLLKVLLLVTLLPYANFSAQEVRQPQPTSGQEKPSSGNDVDTEGWGFSRNLRRAGEFAKGTVEKVSESIAKGFDGLVGCSFEHHMTGRDLNSLKRAGVNRDIIVGKDYSFADLNRYKQVFDSCEKKSLMQCQNILSDAKQLYPAGSLFYKARTAEARRKFMNCRKNVKRESKKQCKEEAIEAVEYDRSFSLGTLAGTSKLGETEVVQGAVPGSSACVTFALGTVTKDDLTEPIGNVVHAVSPDLPKSSVTCDQKRAEDEMLGEERAYHTSREYCECMAFSLSDSNTPEAASFEKLSCDEISSSVRGYVGKELAAIMKDQIKASSVSFFAAIENHEESINASSMYDNSLSCLPGGIGDSDVGIEGCDPSKGTYDKIHTAMKQMITENFFRDGDKTVEENKKNLAKLLKENGIENFHDMQRIMDNNFIIENMLQLAPETLDEPYREFATASRSKRLELLKKFDAKSFYGRIPVGVKVDISAYNEEEVAILNAMEKARAKGEEAFKLWFKELNASEKKVFGKLHAFRYQNQSAVVNLDKGFAFDGADSSALDLAGFFAVKVREMRRFAKDNSKYNEKEFEGDLTANSLNKVIKASGFGSVSEAGKVCDQVKNRIASLCQVLQAEKPTIPPEEFNAGVSEDLMDLYKGGLDEDKFSQFMCYGRYSYNEEYPIDGATQGISRDAEDVDSSNKEAAGTLGGSCLISNSSLFVNEKEDCSTPIDALLFDSSSNVHADINKGYTFYDNMETQKELERMCDEKADLDANFNLRAGSSVATTAAAASECVNNREVLQSTMLSNITAHFTASNTGNSVSVIKEAIGIDKNGERNYSDAQAESLIVTGAAESEESNENPSILTTVGGEIVNIFSPEGQAALGNGEVIESGVAGPLVSEAAGTLSEFGGSNSSTNNNRNVSGAQSFVNSTVSSMVSAGRAPTASAVIPQINQRVSAIDNQFIPAIEKQIEEEKANGKDNDSPEVRALLAQIEQLKKEQSDLRALIDNDKALDEVIENSEKIAADQSAAKASDAENNKNSFSNTAFSGSGASGGASSSVTPVQAAAVSTGAATAALNTAAPSGGRVASENGNLALGVNATGVDFSNISSNGLVLSSNGEKQFIYDSPAIRNDQVGSWRSFIESKTQGSESKCIILRTNKENIFIRKCLGSDKEIIEQEMMLDSEGKLIASGSQKIQSDERESAGRAPASDSKVNKAVPESRNVFKKALDQLFGP